MTPLLSCRLNYSFNNFHESPRQSGLSVLWTYQQWNLENVTKISEREKPEDRNQRNLKQAPNEVLKREYSRDAPSPLKALKAPPREMLNFEDSSYGEPKECGQISTSRVNFVRGVIYSGINKQNIISSLVWNKIKVLYKLKFRTANSTSKRITYLVVRSRFRWWRLMERVGQLN